ncbi:MAG: hypothetical protein GWP23_07925, partial [Synechococcales cyanobacterium H12SWP_bin.12]|nr:hypothetical protein [Synechococcales cyanobacterium H12SWP_bin.12]
MSGIASKFASYGLKYKSCLSFNSIWRKRPRKDNYDVDFFSICLDSLVFNEDSIINKKVKPALTRFRDEDEPKSTFLALDADVDIEFNGLELDIDLDID